MRSIQLYSSTEIKHSIWPSDSNEVIQVLALRYNCESTRRTRGSSSFRRSCRRRVAALAAWVPNDMFSQYATKIGQRIKAPHGRRRLTPDDGRVGVDQDARVFYLHKPSGRGDRDKQSNDRTMQQINFVISFKKNKK